MTQALRLGGIRKSFGLDDVLMGVTLDVEPGEVVGLLGVNGAGKTTLLRIAMGMLHPTAGTVAVFGMDPWKQPVEIKRRVGYVAEDQVLPDHLTVAQVLDLHRRLYPSWNRELENRLLRKLSLDLRKKVRALSKGQARRVALLCACAHRPELLILDEPAGGLDPAARRSFLETAIAVLQDEGAAIVFSSHHMADVERIAGRVALIHQGRMLIDRSLDEVREGYTLAILEIQDDLSPVKVLSIPGCVRVRRHASALHALFEGDPDEVAALLKSQGALCTRVSLEDLFIELVDGWS